MSIDKFIDQFSNAADIDKSILNKNAKFKDLDVWDSLAALTVIAMVDEAYEVTLSGDDLMNSETIQDLWEVVASRSQNASN